MTRKYRRNPIDFEILIASQNVVEITENMHLLDEEIVAEVLATLEQNELYMRRVAHILRMRNPKLENIAIMSEGDRRRIVLLFSDKTGVVVGRRRTNDSRIRNLMRIAS